MKSTDECMFCGHGNANSPCYHEAGCERIFHLSCGQEYGALQQFSGAHNRTFCPEHWPVQQVPAHCVLPRHCFICTKTWHNQVSSKHQDPDDLQVEAARVEETEQEQLHNLEASVFWAPCCNYKVAFHPDCIKRLATKSGIYFRCPNCLDQDVFVPTMKNMGVYVPSKDPQWSSDLTHEKPLKMILKLKCSARNCKCICGSDFSLENNEEWTIMPCTKCGLRGLHKACGLLNKADSSWICNTCVTQEFDTRGSGGGVERSKRKRQGEHGMKKRSKHVASSLESSRVLFPYEDEMSLSEIDSESDFDSDHSEKANMTKISNTTPDKAGPLVTRLQESKYAADSTKETELAALMTILLDAVFKISEQGIMEIRSEKHGFRAVCDKKFFKKYVNK